MIRFAAGLATIAMWAIMLAVWLAGWILLAAHPIAVYAAALSALALVGLARSRAP